MNRTFSTITAISAVVLVTAAIAIMPGCASQTATNPNATAAAPAADNNAKTLANLMEAFNGESNASAKYKEFAKKADEEGYTKVASLFRAASRAEEVHLNNHAVVIKKMGGTPKADIKVPEIKTTEENLKSAITGETYERDTMYTDFMIEARRAGNTDALRTFNFAKTAEAEHAKLYSDALANLAKWRDGKTTYFVCPVCGYTTSNPNLEKCPVDFTPKDKFESIS